MVAVAWISKRLARGQFEAALAREGSAEKIEDFRPGAGCSTGPVRRARGFLALFRSPGGRRAARVRSISSRPRTSSSWRRPPLPSLLHDVTSFVGAPTTARATCVVTFSNARFEFRQQVPGGLLRARARRSCSTGPAREEAVVYRIPFPRGMDASE
jgi:hypothetical protein